MIFVSQSVRGKRIAEIQRKAEEIALKEPIVENYESWLVGDLMWQIHHLKWYSGKVIQTPFHENDYPESLDIWIEHEKTMHTIGSMQQAITTNLEKYELEDITTPFIYRVDEQYARLKEKPTQLVKRFFGFNTRKRDESLCSRLFGETKADVNYHACMRVLAEREEKT